MKTNFFLYIWCCFGLTVYAQKIDASFARNGLYVFKGTNMPSSSVIDFNLLENNQVNILLGSEEKTFLIKLNPNGTYQRIFNTTPVAIQNNIDALDLNHELEDQMIIPKAIYTAPNGSILMLSNKWKENNWITSVNKYLENGSLDTSFGSMGQYENNFSANQDDYLSKNMYVSSQDEIIVVTRVLHFENQKEVEKIAIQKISELGIAKSTKYYDNNHFKLNCSTMLDDQLFIGYSEPVEEKDKSVASYIVKSNDKDSIPDPVARLSIDTEDQYFRNIIVTNSNIYASNIQSEIDNLYVVHKYDSNGSPDASYKNSGEIDFDADIYSADFVVNQQNEVFIISTSWSNEQEIFIKKLLSNGEIDHTFGSDGIAKISLNYPVAKLGKVRLDTNGALYISGDMSIWGSTFGFIAKLKLNVLTFKNKKLEAFIDEVLKPKE